MKSKKIDRLIKGITLKEYLIQQMIKSGWRSLI
jgi:hypothetical protein